MDIILKHNICFDVNTTLGTSCCTTYPKALVPCTANIFWTPMRRRSEAMRRRQRARMKGFRRPRRSDHFPSQDTVKMAMNGAEMIMSYKKYKVGLSWHVCSSCVCCVNSKATYFDSHLQAWGVS